MSPFRLWLFSVVFVVTALLIVPSFLPVIIFIFALYASVFIWGVFDLRIQFFLKTYCSNKQEKSALCLTFDDGPDPNITGDILDLLKENGLKATFFIIGNKAKQFPDIVRRAYDEGHTIACHDLTHSPFSNFRFSSKMTREISQTQSILESIIGKKPRLYRPPAGLANPHLDTALSQLSMDCVGYSARAKDAGNRRIRAIRNIHSLAKPGSVVLLHDCLPVAEYKDEILKQLTLLFATMKQKNISAIELTDMFGIEAYTQGSSNA